MRNKDTSCDIQQYYLYYNILAPPPKIFIISDTYTENHVFKFLFIGK